MKKNDNPKQLFTLSQIDEDIEEGSKGYLELKELFQSAQSLDDVIDSWMSRNLGRELTFSSDPNGEE